MKLPDFETRGVIAHVGIGTDALNYGILFKTARERTEFIEAAKRGVEQK